MVVGVTVLVASGIVATRGTSEMEERVFRAANGAPDAWFAPVIVGMQFGTYVTTPVLAGIVWVSGRRAEGWALLAAGTTAWVSAKIVKRIAPRGRPQHALATWVKLRGPTEGGSGFPSGHAATSTTLAIVLGVALGGWWWPVLTAFALVTWFGRMYVGVHLPLDIAGGAGIGLVVAGLTALVAAAL